MATVKEVYQFIDQIAPFDTQEGFDNAGFLVGRRDRAVRKILVALDITGEVAEEAAQLGAELIVAHHPVMNCTWRPVQSLLEEDIQGRLLRRLYRGGYQ